MKKALLLAFASLSLATACKKDDTTPAAMQVSGTLAGANETPANTSAAKGTVSGTYAPDTKVLTYTVTYSGLTPTAGHLHIGAPGTSGPVAIPFASLTSPITGTVTLSQTQADALTAGNVYANLHSTAYPDGEVRANVIAK